MTNTTTNETAFNRHNQNANINTVRGKAIPLQAWTGPEGSRRLKLPISRQSAHEGGKIVILTQWPHLPPRKYSWYSFLL